MKTLLFCPLYLEGSYLDRYKKWISYYLPNFKDKLGFTEIYFVDNASKPEDMNEFLIYKNPLTRGDSKVTIEHCPERLERESHWGYKYWYRAFEKAVKYAKDNQFDKIIHIDSDVYILDKKLCDYLKNLDSGWNTLWCAKYGFPASEIQVICKDQFDIAYKFMSEDYKSFYSNAPAETEIPFTHVEKSFQGDRYGETRAKQESWMCWYGQTPNDISLKFNE